MTAPILYGLPPNLKAKGQDLREMSDQVERFLTANPGFNLAGAGRFTMDELNLRARTVDQWTVPKSAWKDTRLDWIKVGPDQYRIQYPFADGREILTVSKDLLGHYELSGTIRPTDRFQPVRQRTIATRIHSAEAAAKIGETFIEQERHDALRLMRKDAYWKTKPITLNQMRWLDQHDIPYTKRMTAGEASALRDLWQARRGR